MAGGTYLLKPEFFSVPAPEIVEVGSNPNQANRGPASVSKKENSLGVSAKKQTYTGASFSEKPESTPAQTLHSGISQVAKGLEVAAKKILSRAAAVITKPRAEPSTKTAKAAQSSSQQKEVGGITLEQPSVPLADDAPGDETDDENSGGAGAATTTGEAPVAANGVLTVKEDQPAAEAGTLSATDSDSTALTFSIVANGSKGTAIITNAATGAYTYLPAPEQTGTDTFTFQVSDGVNVSNIASVTVTITPYCTAWTQIAAAPFTSDFTPTPDGTLGKEYRLCTRAQYDTLASTNTLWKSRFKMYADIDVNNGGANNFSIGNGAVYFTGVFDGRGHTFSNYRYVGAASNVGFFGRVHGSAAQIKNLTIANVFVTAGGNTGGLVGTLYYGANVTNCRTTGYVRGASNTGGLVGFVNYAWVSGSSSSVDVDGPASNVHGGLVGDARGHIINSYATGSVAGTSAVGGLVGISSGQVINSYAIGNITASGVNVGGLVGQAINGTTRLMNVFAAGNVTGSAATASIGGLVGTSPGASIVNGYRYSGATCTNLGGGGCNADGTAEAVLANLYSPAAAPLSSWDFADVWVSNAASSAFPTLDPTLLDETSWGTCADHMTDLPFAGGVGSFENPFLICSADQLLYLMSDSTYWTKGYSFKLLSDIDLSTTGLETKIGSTVVPFDGYFDGDGKSILNFTYSTNNDSTATGLFGSVRGYIKRLGLVNATVSATGSSGNVGALVGILDQHNAAIIDSYATGTVTGGTGNYTGGLTGRNVNNGVSLNSYSTVMVTSAGQYVGGIAGFGSALTCFTTGNVTGSSGVNFVGPISGYTGASGYFSSTATCTNNGAGACNAAGTSAAVNTFYSELNAPLTGWDFNNVWQENAGTFPTLR